MLHIRTRGLPIEDLEFVSDSLIRGVAETLGLSQSKLTLEYEKAVYFSTVSADYLTPSFEILNVGLDDTLKSEVVRQIGTLIKSKVANVDYVTVFFQDIDPKNYFRHS